MAYSIPFSDLVSETLSSADEVASLAKESEIEPETLIEFSLFVEKLTPILSELKENKHVDAPPIRKAIESLNTELHRAKTLIKSPKFETQLGKLIEDITHDLGRSLGLVIFASHDIPLPQKENIEELRQELMRARFSLSSGSVNDGETEITEETEESMGEIREEIIEEVIEDKMISEKSEDVILQLKYGDDDEFKSALSCADWLVKDGAVANEWISEEGVIPVMFNRLGSSKANQRVIILRILRSLAEHDFENKEKMSDSGYLSTLVKSLAREKEEQTEALGLLLSLVDVYEVKRKMGRIQGCILILVAIFNGDDLDASRDAEKLLNALSNNSQNALHMAEAGYFEPLVHYLKDGSDMSKILMATALSRMELTDQSKISLGEVAIEPLVKMFNGGKLEAKLSSLHALQNLSNLKQNVQILVSKGIVSTLLQLLFSVTSVMMTLREPASAILAKISQSESLLVNPNIVHQMLSLLSLSGPVIQCHLLQALNNICAYTNASRVRRKMKENGAIQLLLPFLKETNSEIRVLSLELIYTLSKDLSVELTEQIGETNLVSIVNIVSSSASENEKAYSIGILSNLPNSDTKVTYILKKANLLFILISIMNSGFDSSTPTNCLILESIAAICIQFTIPSDKKLQQFSVEQGLVPLLVKLLSNGSAVAKSRAATSLAQLSENSLSILKSRKSRWRCVSLSTDTYCEVHDAYCSVRANFCLVKSGAISHLLKILEGKDRGADEAVLGALSTIFQDEIWENGSNFLANEMWVRAIFKVLQEGSVKSQEKALWIFEKIFRIEAHKLEFGELVQPVLIDLTQKGDHGVKSNAAKILAELELLQLQSSYF